jgi:CBS domain containing-hemolysin-like protein
MEEASVSQLLGLLGALAALLVVRAVAAAMEAALVAVGIPRAQELGHDPGAPGGARSLAALAADPEATAFTLRVATTFSILFVGLLSGAGGVLLLPKVPPWAAGPLAAALVGLLSLPVAAVARGLGAAHGEPVALALALPVRALRDLLRPLAKLVTVAALGRARFTLPPPPLDEMERALAERMRREDGDAQTTSELIHAVFEFRDKVARDVMVPRTEVVGVEIDTPVDQIIRVLAEEGHSRMPVYRGDLDHIEGVLHARDLVPLLAHPELIVLRDVLRPAHFVPWSKPIDQLLREMQKRKLHMGFVVDEFGGVMGICTIEDVLEQIVGDIQDEFEEDEDLRPVEAHGDGSFTMSGAATVGEFNEASGANVPDDQGYETVAGFINALAGAIPSRGDRFFWHGWVFTVADADPRRVTKVRAARVKRS